jgi:muconate cycloisomerase
MKIKSIQTRIVEHALRCDRIVVSPAGRHDQSRFLEVMIEDETSARGFGEAATTALWSGETAETAQWIIQNLFAPVLLNCTFDHPREALQKMDVAAYANPFAKSAVDTALWDAWAKMQNVSVTKLIADRAPVAAIPTRASVGVHPVEDSVRIAREFWGAGIKTLKFKIGSPEIDDAARLREVRAQLGSTPIFTLDANGAYQSADEAVRALEKLLPFGIALLEQPTPRDRISLLADVKKRVSIPIVADECVWTKGDLHEALDCDAFDILSVYPGKNGGFTRALEMAQIAAHAGKQCAIGSNLETDLGQAAMATLAGALQVFPVEKIACDLPAVMFYENSSLQNPLVFANGKIKVPAGLGFGATPIDETVGWEKSS